MEDRAYQTNTIQRVRQAILDGHKSIVVCIPTGGGKTGVAAKILVGLLGKGNRGGFIAHLREILNQTVSTLNRCGVDNVSIIRADDEREDRSKPMQVCSIQTLARRPKMDPPPHVIFIDECHRSTASSYRKYVFETYPDAIVIGLSATPVRNSGAPLGTLYTHLIVGTTYEELIAGKYLEAPLTYSTPVLPDLTNVSTVAGDFNEKELEAAVAKGHLIGNIVDHWLRLAGGRQTVCFAVSIAHSKMLVDAFRMAGVKAEHIDGTTPEDERAAILARVESGETTVICNVAVFCEGIDIPILKCAILAAPTKSIIRYKQCGGRVLRPYEGIGALILDHGGNYDRFGGPVHMDMEWSLTEKAKPKSQLPPHKNCPVCFAYVLSSLPSCPHCGTLFPPTPPAKVKDRKIIPVDLALRTVTDVPQADKDFVLHEHIYARKLGWHWKAIERRFEVTFNRSLPEALRTAIRADYNRDEEWKAKRRERVQQKKPEVSRQRTIAYVGGRPWDEAPGDGSGKAVH